MAVGVIVLVGLLLLSMAATTGQIIIANVDGPPVWVDVSGMSRITVTCPGTETINVPMLRFLGRDVVVTDARTGTVLWRRSVTWDTVFLVRRDLVLTGPPGSSYGPAPVNGCV